MRLTAEARALAETLIDGARKTVMNADVFGTNGIGLPSAHSHL